jgi:adenylate kinase
MCFPKEVIWLSGAPGAGKGTMCKFIMQERGLTSGPIETSSLLRGEPF